MANNELTWINVGISFAFILLNIGVSSVLRLGIGLSILIAAFRCAGQLALVASILHEVFETRNPWLVALICCAFFLLSFVFLRSGHSTCFCPFSCGKLPGHFRGGYVQPSRFWLTSRD